jgi:hypothetical protein
MSAQLGAEPATANGGAPALIHIDQSVRSTFDLSSDLSDRIVTYG